MKDDDKKSDLLPLLATIVVIACVFLILQILFFCWACSIFGVPKNVGEFGDMFGAFNALFSALSFAAIVIALIFQMRDLAYTQRELKLVLLESEKRNELHRDSMDMEKKLAAPTLSYHTIEKIRHGSIKLKNGTVFAYKLQVVIFKITANRISEVQLLAYNFATDDSGQHFEVNLDGNTSDLQTNEFVRLSVKSETELPLSEWPRLLNVSFLLEYPLGHVKESFAVNLVENTGTKIPM